MRLLRYLLFFTCSSGAFACSSEEDITLEVEIKTPTSSSYTVPIAFPQNFRVPADNPITKEGAALGRFLFYDVKLSGNNSMSSGSFHQQQRAIAFLHTLTDDSSVKDERFSDPFK